MSALDELKKSALDRDKLKEALEFARENGLTSFEFQGVKFDVPPKSDPPPVDDGKDIPQPETPFDKLTEEEILFWSTPTFDELIEAKEMRNKELEEERASRG